MDYERMGRRIKEQRQRLRLTQAALAEKTDVTVQFISQVERAKARVSLDTLVRIANALGVTVDNLLLDSLTADVNPQLQELNRLLALQTEDEITMILSITRTILKQYQRKR